MSTRPKKPPFAKVVAELRKGSTITSLEWWSNYARSRWATITGETARRLRERPGEDAV